MGFTQEVTLTDRVRPFVKVTDPPPLRLLTKGAAFTSPYLQIHSSIPHRSELLGAHMALF